MPKTVAVVVGDLGGCKELLGAVKILENRGAQCLWFCDPLGKAVTVLNKNNIVFEQRLPDDNDKVDAILVGTSSSACGLQIAWTKYGHEKNIPVFWMEDLYGTGERQAVAEVSPDVMLVIDKTAKRIAQSVRPTTPTLVVGKPTFGDLAIKLQRQDEIHQKIRTRLNLANADILLTYASGGEVPARAEAQMKMLVDQLYLWKSVVFAPLLHPKLPEALRDKLWKDAKEAFGPRLVDARNLDITELVISSDMLFSDWGCTESYVGVLGTVPVGLMMFPDDKRLNDCGYKNVQPPLLMTGSADNITDDDSLRNFIDWATDCIAMRHVIDMVLEARSIPYLSLLQPGAEINIADAVMSDIK